MLCRTNNKCEGKVKPSVLLSSSSYLFRPPKCSSFPRRKAIFWHPLLGEKKEEKNIENVGMSYYVLSLTELLICFLFSCFGIQLLFWLCINGYAKAISLLPDNNIEQKPALIRMLEARTRASIVG